MSVVFNGSEVNQITMDGVNLDAVMYNGVCVFGEAAFIKNAYAFNSLASKWSISPTGSSVLDGIVFVTEQPGSSIVFNGATYAKAGGSSYSEVISEDDSPNVITVYLYSRVVLGTTRCCFVVYAENNPIIVFPEDCTAMFYGERIPNIPIDLGNRINTSNVLYMHQMFEGCRSVTGLDRFDVSNVRTMGRMFANFWGTALDLSAFKAPNCTGAPEMFSSASVVTIYGTDKMLTNEALVSTNMFSNCSSLIGGSGTEYDDAHVDAEYARIDDPAGGRPGYFTLKTA